MTGDTPMVDAGTEARRRQSHIPPAATMGDHPEPPGLTCLTPQRGNALDQPRGECSTLSRLTPRGVVPHPQTPADGNGQPAQVAVSRALPSSGLTPSGGARPPTGEGWQMAGAMEVEGPPGNSTSNGHVANLPAVPRGDDPYPQTPAATGGQPEPGEATGVPIVGLTPGGGPEPDGGTGWQLQRAQLRKQMRQGRARNGVSGAS